MLDTAPQELLTLAEALVALLLGGLVGFEREAAGKWAGIRTHMLVCLSAFLFVELGQLVTAASAQVWAGAGVPEGALSADPVRIIQAVVVGISFVGAGAVFRDPDRNVARGLTTAATLLVVAPVGVAVALGRYVLAAGVAVLVVALLRVLGRVERRVFGPGHGDVD
ncbi:MAG TPA: MgtC/SapB family protein [Rubricoccaceae bacterium]|jgi:putative Mg2+ transporter-C (MgtC) family protein|nr:MgtC/SapB family protein [Rubricoccaceae bacterium]